MNPTRRRIFRNMPLAERPLAAQVAALFANGEQGLWYDVDGFRDAWNNVGPELVTNGDFSSGTAGWALAASWNVSGGVLAYNSAASNSDAADCTQVYSSIQTGGWYSVTFTVTSGSIPAGSVLVMRGTSIQIGNRGPGTYTVLGQAGGSTAGYGIRFVGYAVGTFALDNISVKEWVGLPKCALFQDAAGTLPAYLPGQGQADPPIGLVLDRRKAFATAAVVVPNGDYSGGTAGWSGGATASLAVVSGALQVTCSGSGYGAAVAQTPFYVPAGVLFLKCTMAAGATIAVGDGVTYNKYGTYPSTASGTFYGLVVPSGNVVLTLLTNSNVAATVKSFGPIAAYSISGNHAYQATTASRPTLSARYNLLLSTESLADSPWTINGTCTRTGAFSTAPNGTLTATRIQLGTLSTDEVRQTFSTAAGAGVGYSVSIWLKSNTGADQQVRLKNTHINVLDNFQTVTVTSEWQRFSLSVTNGASAGTGQLLGITNSAGGGAKDVLAWGADLRLTNDGVGLPPYQRVVDANTYDTTGFPLYLKFDGIDDFLQTASVDFSTSDKILVSMAMRKFSDATAAVPLELSTVYTNAGAFAVIAPVSNAAPTIAFVSKGASASVTAADSTAVAPISTISTGYSDIGGKVAILRTNGLVKATTVVDQGGGNYGIYPLYIGRRAGTSLPFGGRVYGLLIRAGAANDSQIGRVERYINQKAKVF